MKGRSSADVRFGIRGTSTIPSINLCLSLVFRGWTAIQLREGDNLSCEGALIEDNKIGPAGEEWIIEMDGEDPENSPRGRPLASGLSIACRGSTVVRNVSSECAVDMVYSLC
jgi:hypothetical protein